MKTIVCKVIGWLTVALLFGGLSFSLLAQDQPTATSSGPLVQVSFIATNSAGKSTDTVRKEDVHVFEDKIEQTVLTVEADQRPVDCVLLIDASGSLKNLIGTSREAAKQIIINRRPDDEILIVRFVSSDKVAKQIPDFTKDGDALIAALNTIHPEPGQSAVIDAIYLATKVFAESNKTSSERRRAIVIITDGEERNSYYTTKALNELLRKTDVQIFALGFVMELNTQGGLMRKSPHDRAEGLLKSITEETGGRLFLPTNKSELIESLQQIIASLSSQVRVTYRSPKDDKKIFRKLQVVLTSSTGEKLNPILRRSGYQPTSQKAETKPTEQKL